MPLTAFSERIEILEADQEAKTVRQCLIRSGKSANGRVWPRSTLEDALSLFEGATTFANHGSWLDGQDVLKTSGWVRGVYYDVAQKGLMATRHFSRIDAGQTIWGLVEDMLFGEAPNMLIGASVAVAGEGDYNDEGDYVVNEITEVLSVDDVAYPAAQQGRPTYMAADGKGVAALVMKHFKYEEWLESRPDFVKRLRKEQKAARQTKVVKEHEEKALAAVAKLALLGREHEAALAELAEVRHEYAALMMLEGVVLPQRWRASLIDQMSSARMEDWPDLISAEMEKARSTDIATRSGRAPVAREQPGLVVDGVSARSLPLPREDVRSFNRRRGRE